MAFVVAKGVKMEAATAATTTTTSDSCSRVSVQEDEVIYLPQTFRIKIYIRLDSVLFGWA